MQTLLLLAKRVERLEHERQGGTSNTVIVLVIAGAVAVAILGRSMPCVMNRPRIATHGMDRSRIEKYAGEQGWDLLSCQWKLFGPGWFGNNKERIYAITYRDGQGRTHSAFAKTSALAGVYLTEDRVEG